MITALKVAPDSGEMSVAFQILMPPLDFDLASTGKGPTSGYVFFTSYNTEMAQILKVSEIQPIEFYPKAENKDPDAVWDMAQAGVTREGKNVNAKLIAVRSRFVPDRASPGPTGAAAKGA